MYIYVIINLINGKYYVGQTILNPPIKRWHIHVAYAKRKPNKNDMLITRAIRKYGPENFTFEVIKTLRKGSTQKQLNQMECLAIIEYNSMHPHGYNIKEGGNNGKHSKKSKKKMSVTKKGKSPWNKGIPWSQSAKDAISAAKLGIPQSQMHKDAISHATKGVPKGPYPKSRGLAISKAKKGIPLSQSHKDAIAASRKGIPLSQSHKDAVSAAKKGISTGPLSKAHRLALSKSHKGKPWSAARRAAYEAKWGSNRS